MMTPPQKFAILSGNRFDNGDMNGSFAWNLARGRSSELEDNEMWSIVRFLGIFLRKEAGYPAVYKEGEEEHKEMTQSPQQQGEPGHKHPHQ
jgi:hypothetical protein